MNSVDFCFWLQGYIEIAEPRGISEKQFEVIKKHLNLVFLHEIDPLREEETTASKEELDVAHAVTMPGIVPGINDLKVRC